MGKWFCPKCKILTYGLRYIFNERSEKPKGDPQYCRKCHTTFSQSNCLAGGDFD